MKIGKKLVANRVRSGNLRRIELLRRRAWLYALNGQPGKAREDLAEAERLSQQLRK